MTTIGNLFASTTRRRSRARTSLQPFACLLLLASATLQGCHASVQPPASAERPRIAIENFGQVDAHYYRGAQPRPGDYATLAALGVRTVISLQDAGNPDEPARVEAAGMRFHRIPMTSELPPTPAQITLFLEIVSDPDQQPVYVHCAGGRHRTGVMTAVYRMEHDGWTADQAFKEMKRYGFGAGRWHSELTRFVNGYRPASTRRP